ncbi:hypothetical protein CKO25_13805 [Thiocapsa imhoffii]|uniref:Methyltransferase type 11 domain-containing protein n=1 Tax=Thiocapsa imhoffii TaxID=382777 RepID=A0A9X0WJ70_9GAMM|nr:class I SAM-dependent methyltransferase [Thiocapsa imhoffii]MBK1645704.1 hypothetical protein [Thiocapsa imhoffii]
MSVESTYNRYAAFYDFIYGSVLQDGRKKLARLISKEPGRHLLEIGVGSGLMLPLYPDHLSITGVDISNQMLAKARKRAGLLRNKTITLHHVDGENGGFPDESFDHVVLPYVYSVTPDPDHLIAESFRVCKSGGNIWILNHFSGFGTVWDYVGLIVKSFPDSVGFRSDFSYEDYVVSKGWQVEEIHKANVLGLSRIIKVRKPLAA